MSPRGRLGQQPMRQRTDQRALLRPLRRGEGLAEQRRNRVGLPGTQIDEFHARVPSQPPGIRAVTSISIFIRGSCSPATIIVAAGRASPSQRASPASRPPSRAIGQDVAHPHHVGHRRARLAQGRVDVAERLFRLRRHVPEISIVA
jgi:hypothetical protein